MIFNRVSTDNPPCLSGNVVEVGLSKGNSSDVDSCLSKWGPTSWFVSWALAILLVFLLLYAINRMPGIPAEYQIHWGFIIAIVLSIGIFIGIIYWVMTAKTLPFNQFDSSSNIAIIGAGASGSMAVSFKIIFFIFS